MAEAKSAAVRDAYVDKARCARENGECEPDHEPFEHWEGAELAMCNGSVGFAADFRALIGEHLIPGEIYAYADGSILHYPDVAWGLDGFARALDGDEEERAKRAIVWRRGANKPD